MPRYQRLLKGMEAPETAMPVHVQPMMALLANLPEHDELYGFEYKWDGMRAVFYMHGDGHRIETRNLLEVTHGYPELDALARELAGTTAVLDGEIVAFNEKGYPSFGRLQHRLGVAERKLSERVETIPVTFMLFDVLHLEGRDLMGLPYIERREVLEGMKLSDERWRTPPYFVGEGETVLEVARENHLEGVVAKVLNSPYRPGKRNGEWLKTKFVHRQEFVIGGWTGVSTGAPGIGALMVGYHDPPDTPQAARRLIYAGKVGSGYSDADRRALQEMLEAREVADSPFFGVVQAGEAHFARPELVAEVEFRGWTNTGHMRQPAYKGLRTDKDAADVIREDKAVSVEHIR